MRQNSKGLSHSHCTHTPWRETKSQPKKIHSRRTMQKATRRAASRPLPHPHPALALLSPCCPTIIQNASHKRMGVCVCVCVESFAAMLASHPRAPHSCRSSIALAPAGFRYSYSALGTRCSVLGARLSFRIWCHCCRCRCCCCNCRM